MYNFWFVIVVQIAAALIHGRMLKMYKKYCGDCEWWSDLGAWIFFIVGFIPVVGFLACVIGPIDYIKNIVETLERQNKRRVVYLCDEKKCKDCNAPTCTHTWDVTHAKNFFYDHFGECYTENYDSHKN